MLFRTRNAEESEKRDFSSLKGSLTRNDNKIYVQHDLMCEGVGLLALGTFCFLEQIAPSPG